MAGALEAGIAARDRDYFARWERDPSIGPPQGESPRRVAARARGRVQDLQARHAEGPVLIVSHKALLRILLCELFAIDLRHYRRGAWPVGAVTQIDLGAAPPRSPVRRRRAPRRARAVGRAAAPPASGLGLTGD